MFMVVEVHPKCLGMVLPSLAIIVDKKDITWVVVR
jgi:hypothetical protein